MKKEEFKKYWDILKRNYNDKTHTQEDLKLYFSIFKEEEEKVFKEAIKQTLKNCKYFPNIAEINIYLPHKDKPSWSDKVISYEKVSDEEQKELEKIIEKYKED